MRHLRSSTRARVPGIAPGTLAGLGAHGLGQGHARLQHRGQFVEGDH